MGKTLTGVVTSAKSDKTIVITVTTRKTHPIYKKQYISSAKFMAHDEENQAKVGDKVIISETRPLSARKRFTLEKILEKAVIAKEDLAIIESDEKKPTSKSKKDTKPAEEDKK